VANVADREAGSNVGNREAGANVGNRAAGADMITYREAVADGLARELRRDPAVVCLGEDIGAAGGVFKTTQGLLMSSVLSGSGTPRSPSRPSSASRWAPR